jgi:hypothetical protein
MNTKLALSAIVAALMLTACAKQESAGTDQAANPPAPAPSADQNAPPPATAPADQGMAPAPGAAPAASDTMKPAEGAAPATPPSDNTMPPKQ